jgi:isochorismate hydrolase
MRGASARVTRRMRGVLEGEDCRQKVDRSMEIERSIVILAKMNRYFTDAFSQMAPTRPAPFPSTKKRLRRREKLGSARVVLEPSATEAETEGGAIVRRRMAAGCDV